jgi:toxin ParE1/3/4
MEYRVAPSAERDLDGIWLHTAKESGSVEIANRLIDSITDRFFLIATFPHMGRRRDADFGFGLRSYTTGEFVIVYATEAEEVSILRVVHGRRDLQSLFR